MKLPSFFCTGGLPSRRDCAGFPSLRSRQWAAISLLLAQAWLGVSGLLAQGALAPTAGPAPTMKRLDEVEARVIVNATNTPASGSYTYSIAPAQFPNGGSFYLTGNLNVAGGGGISITANNVTLDLNGYTLNNTVGSTSNLFSGVYVGGNNVTVRNGAVTGTFGSGVGSASGTSNARVANLSVSGSNNAGISLSGNTGSVVQGSTVNGVSGTNGTGIVADAVSDSTATGVAGVPVTAKTVSNVSGSSTNAANNVTPVVVPVDPRNVAGADVRTPIPGSATGTVSTYTISTPGSYYLTNNFTVTGGNGIVIAADGVTLDLNGFTVSSNASSATGDAVSFSGARQNVSVQNGHIKSGSTVSNGAFTGGGGFANGVNWPSSVPVNVRVSGISVAGISGFGIDVGGEPSATVSNCTVRVAQNFGIRAGSVSDSTALLVGGTPISATTVSNCVVSGYNASTSVLDTVNTNVAGVQTSVNTVNANVAGVQGSVNTLQTSVNGVQGTATGINTTVGLLQDGLIGARIPIAGSASLVTISQPGSYYLTGNITVASGDGINITASNVTLDLNGFAVASTSSSVSGYGISTPGSTFLYNLCIRNGNVVSQTTGANGNYTAKGFGIGINLNYAKNAKLDSLNIARIGGTGISSANDGSVLITSCTVNLVSSTGISGSAVCRDCYVSACNSTGIACTTAENCTAYSDTATGISAYGCVTNCFGYGKSGIIAPTITNSIGQAAYGIVTASDYTIDATGGVATNCTARGVYNNGSSNVGGSLRATLANGCAANGPTSIGYKYNMP